MVTFERQPAAKQDVFGIDATTREENDRVFAEPTAPIISKLMTYRQNDAAIF